MAPLFEHYGVELWMPETGGQVDYACEHDERAMAMLGLSSRREIARTCIRVRPAMGATTRQGRRLGGVADGPPRPQVRCAPAVTRTRPPMAR
jgi:hypothetical protein